MILVSARLLKWPQGKIFLEMLMLNFCFTFIIRNTVHGDSCSVCKCLDTF